VSDNFENMWIMDSHAPDYEPLQSSTIAALAAAQGVQPQELMLDALLADGGRGVVWYPYEHGYSERNYDNVRLGLMHPRCVVGNAGMTCCIALQCIDAVHRPRHRYSTTPELLRVLMWLCLQLYRHPSL
jgi:N-acyl-D-aspartate/D-glutamate deacylase